MSPCAMPHDMTSHALTTLHSGRGTGARRRVWPVVFGLMIGAPLTACGWTDVRPVSQVVPADPLVLSGDWSGALEDAGGAPPMSLRLHVAATYVNEKTYTVRGDAVIDDTTYALEGTVEAVRRTTFTPQYTPAQGATVALTGSLTLNGEPAGRLHASNVPRSVNSHVWSVSLRDAPKHVTPGKRAVGAISRVAPTR